MTVRGADVLGSPSVSLCALNSAADPDGLIRDSRPLAPWISPRNSSGDYVRDNTLLLTLAIAFVTTYLFYERNLKASARRHLTRLALAARMAHDLLLLGGNSAWAPLEPSG